MQRKYTNWKGGKQFLGEVFSSDLSINILPAKIRNQYLGDIVNNKWGLYKQHLFDVNVTS